MVGENYTGELHRRITQENYTGELHGRIKGVNSWGELCGKKTREKNTYRMQRKPHEKNSAQ